MEDPRSRKKMLAGRQNIYGPDTGFWLPETEDVEDSMLITKVLEPLLEPGSVVKAAPTIGRPSEEVGADGDCEAVVGDDEEAAAGSAGAGAGAEGSGSQLLVVH